MQTRFLQMHDIKCTRDSDGNNDLIVEGYFAVFNEDYRVWSDVTESIAPGAFDESVSQDVRALYNHNTDAILGRTSAGTLQLRQDSRGLWGQIKINPKDSDAVNVYERIKRGDITGCSFGFDIESEERTVNSDGSVHFTIIKVNPLYEVSPCVFPAYEATNIESRGRDLEEIRKRAKDAWKARMLARVKGEINGTQSTDAPKED